MFRKFISAMIVAGSLAVATACGNAGYDTEGQHNGGNVGAVGQLSQVNATGRFVETSITPAGHNDLFTLTSPAGNLVAYSADLSTRFYLSDGVTWAESPGPGADSNVFATVTAGAYLPDGRLLVYLDNVGMVAVNAAGDVEHVPVEAIDQIVADGMNASMYLIEVVDQDQFILSYSLDWIGHFMQNVDMNQVDLSHMGIDLEEIDLSGLGFDLGEIDLGEIDLGEIDLGEIDLGAIDLGGIEIAGFDLGSIDLDSIDLGAMQDMMGGHEFFENIDLGDIQGMLDGMGIDLDNLDLEAMQTMRQGHPGRGAGGGGAMVFGGSADTDGPGPGHGAMRVTAPAAGAGGMAMNFDTMFASTTSVHSLSTGATLAELAPPLLPIGINPASGTYGLQIDSIVHHESGNITTVLPGGAFAFNGQSTVIKSFNTVSNASGDNIFAINLQDQDGNHHIYLYAWDADAGINPSQVISIWSLEENPLVRAAITELWRRNPDAYITYEIALAGDTAMSQADAIRNLNTRLLGGSGPDIIVLDGVPIESYAARGMLMDLSATVNVSDVYDNLLTPFTAPNGNLYTIPTQFKVPMLMGTEAELSANQTLSALTNTIVTGNPPVSGGAFRGLAGLPASERPAIYFTDLQELFDILWYTSSPAFVTGNQLNTDVIEEFFASIEAISAMYNLAEPAGEGFFTMINSAVSTVGGRQGLGAINLTGSLTQYMSQMANMGSFAVDNLTLLQMMMMRGDADLAAFPGLVPGAWVPSTIAGVSADSANYAFAKAFIDTMLSLPVQEISHGLGLPVTAGAIAAQIDVINQTLTDMNMDPFEIDLSELIRPLTTPSIVETTLYDIIWQAAERLATGQLTLEGAVLEVEQNTRNYLAERQ